jgi:hypothetical protein
MNQHSQRLLARLDAIGAAVRETGRALALIGLGSSGQERERLDAYSDLDFFVIARPGAKAGLLQSLDWLAAVAPIAYQFLNTADGYKLLFADGIFCEFAIFEPAELTAIGFSAERIVWADPSFSLADVARPAAPPPTPPTDWLIGEILTNLYVGLGRYRRGEKLSAARFIQGYAVDRLLELSAQIESPQPAMRDPFGHERRYEQRFPRTAEQLPRFIQGYDRSIASAQAILAFVERHFPVSPALKAEILALCVEPAS